MQLDGSVHDWKDQNYITLMNKSRRIISTQRVNPLKLSESDVIDPFVSEDSNILLSKEKSEGNISKRKTNNSEETLLRDSSYRDS